MQRLTTACIPLKCVSVFALYNCLRCSTIAIVLKFCLQVSTNQLRTRIFLVGTLKDFLQPLHGNKAINKNENVRRVFTACLTGRATILSMVSKTWAVRKWSSSRQSFHVKVPTGRQGQTARAVERFTFHQGWLNGLLSTQVMVVKEKRNVIVEAFARGCKTRRAKRTNKIVTIQEENFSFAATFNSNVIF